MDVNDVSGAGSAGFVARRVFMPRQGVESWTLIGPDRRPVEPVDRYLSHLTFVERSPNTIEGYARDLKAYFSFLADRGLRWDRVGVAELAEFAAWVRRPASNVIVLADEAARLSPRSVNRMLTAVVGFYEFHGREGNDLARRLVVETRSGHGSFKPFLHGLARPRRRGRAIRLREVEALPRTLTLEQVAAVIDAQRRLLDRLLFALLASAGMRIGQR